MGGRITGGGVANGAYVMAMHKTAWLILILSLVGCGHSEAAQPQPQEAPPAATSGTSAEPAEQAQQASATQRPENFDSASHMEAMQKLATHVRDAIVVGNLPGAKKLAAELKADAATQSFEGPFHAYYERLETALDDITIAGNLEQAGQALGASALACGNCHLFAHGGPRGASVEADLPTQGDETMDERMQRHDVAIEQLWLGLTKPSDDMWLMGGRTLASAPLAPPTHDDKAGMELMAQEVENLRNEAHNIRLADTPVKRADIFGRMIARCGTCHRQVEP